MSEITFLCPECGQKVAVDTNGLGFDLACPHCGKTVPVPWENLSSEAQSQTSASESAPPLQVLPPKSPAEKNLLLKKLRQEKREIVAKKRELTIAIAEIRQEARRQSANVRCGPDMAETTAYERRKIRQAKEAALAPLESKKAQLEQELLNIERRLLSVERFE